MRGIKFCILFNEPVLSILLYSALVWLLSADSLIEVIQAQRLCVCVCVCVRVRVRVCECLSE